MTIKELENELNIPRATVRFYEKENIESFDENFYWNYVADEEEKGNKFIEILDGITKYEKHLVLNYFGLEDSEGELNTDRLRAAFKIMAYIIGGGICYMIFYLIDNGEVSFSKFKEGAIVPVVWIIMASVVGLPLYFLGMKYPKVAAGIKKFLFICAGIITVLLFGLFIYSRL